MKKLLILLLLVQTVSAQSIRIDLPAELATKTWVRTYIDSLLKARLADPAPDPVDPPKQPPASLTPCDAGPDIRSILNVTAGSLVTVFHGNNVFGIDWQISQGNQIKRSGSIKPTSSDLSLYFDPLPAGTYTLKLMGNTCFGVSSRDFEIKSTGEGGTGNNSPPASGRVGARGNFELFMNLTGYGFNPPDRHGMNPEWVERIEAFKYDWGYGITGIRLCMRWYDWEPTASNFQRAGLQKVIAYCRERGLKLSVFFWPFRNRGDGFIPDGHYMVGHKGKEFQFEANGRMGSFSSDVVTAKMAAAARELARELATYEGAYYMAVGAGDAEEFINPVVNLGYADPQLTGFEPVAQEKFRAYLTAKGRAFQMPQVTEWTNGVALQMGNETGKDFARFTSLSMTRYFNAFAAAVKEGSSGKILSCYMYPDAGSPQNAWFLHANFATQAAAADVMYGTDGNDRWDNQRKRLCNAVNLGMGKISMSEWDAIDLGENGGYCSPLLYGQMESEFRKAYQSGMQVICYAMSFCPVQIRAMEPHLRRLHSEYIDKPYTRPDWPVTTVPITPAYWKGQEIYAPYWMGSNYLRPDDTDFWGSGR